MPAKLARRAARGGGEGATPALGITGTGGAGKSSLTDELVRRFRLDQDDRLRIAILSIDPSRRKSGGALLGDRIRMNAIDHPHVYMRSLATRDTGSEVSKALPDVIAACKVAGFDLIIVETSGIGQGDAAIVPLVDLSLYVMTPEFGAASQLEKIDMLDFADFVAINKFDRKGAADALRDVRKQVQRNRERFTEPPDDDAGVRHDRLALQRRRRDRALPGGRRALAAEAWSSARAACRRSRPALDRPERDRAGGARALPRRHRRDRARATTLGRGAGRLARERQQLRAAKAMLAAECKQDGRDARRADRRPRREARPARAEAARHVAADAGGVRGRRVRGEDPRPRDPHQPHDTSLSGTKIRKVALPRFEDEGEILRWQLHENVPGSFPFTAGVFAFKRENEDPTRMFAGEGDPFRTNRRFHLLADGMPAKRLSTAFDSVTLYGFDPDRRPDIYGKVGQLRRVDRDARRPEGALLGLRPLRPERPRCR